MGRGARVVGLVVALIMTLGACNWGQAGRSAGQLIDEAAEIAGRARSIDELQSAGSKIRPLGPELDDATNLRRTQVLQDLDRRLLAAYAAQLDGWAVQASATAAAAGDDAQRALVRQADAGFVADLKAAAEEVVTGAACDRIAELAYPTRNEDEEESTLAGDLFLTLTARYQPAGLRTFVDWAKWGRDATKRSDQIVTSLNDYPERVDLFLSPSVARATVAAERFCFRTPRR